jgi:integrase
MNKLEATINTVLQQLKPELAPSTWESREFYFRRMLKIAKSLDIDVPCQKLYDAYIADAAGRGEGRQLHIRCVKLLDAAAETKARNNQGILFNEAVMPSLTKTEEYFSNRQYPLTDKTNIDFIIVKAEIEMKYLGLSTSTMGQYRHAWIDIRRYLCIREVYEYDEQLLQCFLTDIGFQRDNGTMNEWKWKINRKATLVLMEIANTGRFEWCKVKNSIEDVNVAIDEIRMRILLSLQQRNLSKSTISLHGYVFRKLIEFADVKTREDLHQLLPERIQDVVLKFAEVCNRRSMATILPILRSLLTSLHTSCNIERDLSGVVLSGFVQRNSVAAYISDNDQIALTTQLEFESKRNRAMILLALKLGLRDCDICNLEFNDVDWRNDKIRLNQKKGGEPLVLPLLAEVGNALMDYIFNERPKRDDGYPYIFLRAQAPHIKLSSIYSVCSRLLNRMSIKPVNGDSVGVHLLRYTMVYRLLKAKVPHQVITDALGHTSKESDKPYLSMEEPMLRMCALDLSIVGKVSWKGGA